MASQRRDPVRLTSDEVYRLMGIRWKNLGAYERGRSDTTAVKAKTMYRMKIADFVFNRIDTDKGAFSVVGADMDGSVASNEFPAYRCVPEELIPEYLWLHFQQPEVLASLRPAGSDGRARWKEADFERYTLRLPPLEEQQRIVDLIGSLDDAIEAADGAAAKSLRTAIELRRVYFEKVKDSMTVGEVYDVIVGKQLQSNAKAGDPAPYLRAGNIGNGYLDVNEIKSMRFTESELSRLELQPLDVVIVEGGNGYGKSAVWNSQVSGRVALQNHVLRLRSTTPGYSSDYAHQWARWCHEQSQFKSTGTGIPNLGVGKIRKMLIPVVSETSSQEIEILVTADMAVAAATAYATSLRSLRSELLTALLSGEHEIPESYDAVATSQLEPAA